MSRSAVALLAAMLLGTAMAAGQEQRLSDVAGNITLRAPSQGHLFVDLGSSNQSMTRPEILVELTQELEESIRAASSVLDEARAYDPFFSQSWRDRMIETLIELGLAGYSVDAAQPPAEYVEAHQLVLDGVGECEQAEEVVRAAIEQDVPIFGAAIRNLADGGRYVSDALEQMRRIRFVELAEAPPAVTDPIAATLGIESLCASRSAGDTSRYEQCVAGQRAALRTLGARFSSTVFVDESTFNSIRNSCRSEWPVDMAGRDRCELRRIAEVQ